MDEIKFEDFANFKDKPATLPFSKGVNEGLQSSPGEMIAGHGSFSTTIEIDDKRAAKVTRLLNYGPFGILQKDRTVGERFAVDKTSDPVLDEKEVLKVLSAYASERRNIYQVVRGYMGEHIPRLFGSTISESPRKIIQKELHKHDNPLHQPADEVLERVPETEIAVVEIWENLGNFKSLEDLNYKEQAALYKDEGYRKAMEDFATTSLRMLVDGGVMIDISDWGGIGVRTENRKHAVDDLEKIELLVNHDENKLQVIPRNTAFINGQVICYDTYPVENIRDFVDRPTLMSIARSVKDRNSGSIRSLFSNQEVQLDNKGNDEERKKLFVVCYLVLLDKLGAKWDGLVK